MRNLTFATLIIIPKCAVQWHCVHSRCWVTFATVPSLELFHHPKRKLRS